MELFLRDNDLSNWVEIDGGVSLKIAYPNYEQEKEITAAQIHFGEEQNNTNYLDYCALIIQYCVKDWKGVINKRTGEEIECKITNGKLDAQLMAALVRVPEIIAIWANEIFKQLDFNDTDKKK